MRPEIVIAAALLVGFSTAAWSQSTTARHDTCLDCHSALENELGQPARMIDTGVHKRNGFSCAGCHGSHGVAPPGVASVEQACGTCHAVFQDLFDQSPHKPAFEAVGFSACMTCHKNHDVLRSSPEMLGVDGAAVCLRCHTKGDPGWVAAATMRHEIDKLRSALTEAERVLKQAETSGMEVPEGRLQLASAQEEWIKARVQVHGFRLEAVKGPVSRGLEMAQKSRRAGLEALRERNIRRLGVAASLATMVTGTAGLWLAVRHLRRKRMESTHL